MKIKSIAITVLLIFSIFMSSISALGSSVENNLTSEPASIDPLLEEKMATTSVAISVIITFKGDSAPNSEHVEILQGFGVQTGVLMKTLPMAGVLATPDQIRLLASSEDVRSIYYNQELTLFNYDSTAMTGVDKVRADKVMTKENNGMPVSGKNITVVVNDSGVDGTHKDIELGRNLIQNVMGTTNLHALSSLLPITYTEDVPNTDTNSGHGTHVAGTVGGTGVMSNGKYEGAAPGANLLGYGSGGALFILDALGGFDYSLTHQFEYGIRVITNSWGSTGGFDPANPINIASKRAYDRGIVVTFAAGNEGPGEDTHNPYAKAPWVISVAAGEKNGKLTDFSSRGVKDKKETFTIDGETWTWEDSPSITAPGVDIISTKVIAPLTALSATDDAEQIETAYLPYYTHMSGTSMATPHVAGIVALMLEANPQLSPDEVKEILQKTATNIPGAEPWEVGAGYVNAYAAVDASFEHRQYGETLNMNHQFNSEVNLSAERSAFTVDYNPLTSVSDNQYSFQVPEGISQVVAKIDAQGLEDETGNTINLVLIAPDGTEYGSGISLLFTLYFDRVVSVNSPQAGEWSVELRGIRGDELNPTDGIALPETVTGTLTMKKSEGFTGLNDITGHAAADAIKMAVSQYLIDGYADGNYYPDQLLTRAELARHLVMGAEVRQYLPSDNVSNFSDITSELVPFVEAVTAQGAALRDHHYTQMGVIRTTENGMFNPNGEVNRADLAYSLVQSLGFQDEALSLDDEPITVQYGDQRIAIEDEDQIPVELRGYVQLALDLNIINAYFTITQGQYDIIPKMHAQFEPTSNVTRGDFAVAMTRFYNAFLK